MRLAIQPIGFKGPVSSGRCRYSCGSLLSKAGQLLCELDAPRSGPLLADCRLIGVGTASTPTRLPRGPCQATASLAYECRLVAGKGRKGALQLYLQSPRLAGSPALAEPFALLASRFRTPVTCGLCERDSVAHFDSEHHCDFAAPVYPPLTAPVVEAGNPTALWLALWIAGDFLDQRNVARPQRYDDHVFRFQLIGADVVFPSVSRKRSGARPLLDVGP